MSEFDIPMDVVEEPKPAKARKAPKAQAAEPKADDAQVLMTDGNALRIQQKQRRRKIIIDEVKDAPPYETVGYNGVVYQIQRGVEVDVPEGVVEILRHAIASRLVEKKNPDGTVDWVPRQYSAIPWRLVD